MSEIKFNMNYHKIKSYKYNQIYNSLRLLYVLLSFISAYFIVKNEYIILITGLFLTFALWIVSIKIKSLRNINYYAYKEFEKMYNDELTIMFK